MYSRLLKPPTKTSFFLFGPRGVGKTTWVKSKYPKAVYIDLLDSKTFTQLFTNPSRIEERIPKDFTDWIVIDEVQKAPELLNEVHRLIENKHLKFILTGSSARKLRRGGVNLLAGRALVYHMHPLTAIELGERFTLSDCVTYGCLPSVFDHEDRDAYLASYIQAYLQQEVIQEGISRNLSAFARFLETASFSQGSVLTMSEVAREAAVGRRMAEDYFCALEDLLVGVRLPVFSKRAKRKLVSHAKFYYFDVGVYHALRPVSAFDDPEMIGGVALESLFMQNLRAVNEYLKLGFTLYYFRTLAGVEVDFVAYGPKGILAFEVKSKREIFSSDLTGLKTFQQDYPMAKCYMIYGGNERRYYGSIEAIPFVDAIRNLPEIMAAT